MMDAESLRLLAGTISHALSTSSAQLLPAQLLELGWTDVTTEAPDASGMLLREQGRLCAASPSLDVLVTARLGLDPTDFAVLYPNPTSGMHPESRRVRDRHVDVTGVALAGFDRASQLLVPLSDGSMTAVELDGLRREPVVGIDPDARWTMVSGVARAEGSSLGQWSAAAAVARRGIGHELLGLAEAIQDIATQHVTDRHQFGQPIARFQAVKHSLAEVEVALEAARGALAESWLENRASTDSLARIAAGRAHTVASRSGMQVCGAIGYTWEFALHRFVRRGMILDGLLGTWRSELVRLGAEVRTAPVPRVPPLR